jgi:hypothetical protein
MRHVNEVALVQNQVCFQKLFNLNGQKCNYLTKDLQELHKQTLAMNNSLIKSVQLWQEEYWKLKEKCEAH